MLEEVLDFQLFWGWLKSGRPNVDVSVKSVPHLRCPINRLHRKHRLIYAKVGAWTERRAEPAMPQCPGPSH